MTTLLTATQLASVRDGAPVFQPVDTVLEGGQALEILGANGAGKSTLLRTLAGLHGEFDGTFACTHVLYQGHRLALDELLSPLDNLQWYGDLAGAPATETALKDALDRVGMRRYAFTPVGRLSQGQQRRIAMARWLLAAQATPALLWLLDEPVTALDTSGQALLCELLDAHCAGGGAVAYATHVPLALAEKTLLEVLPHDRELSVA